MSGAIAAHRRSTTVPAGGVPPRGGARTRPRLAARARASGAGELAHERAGELARALGYVRGGVLPALERGRARVPGAERVQSTPCACGPNAVEELEQAKPADLVGGVVEQAQERDEVLDVGGVEE